MNKVALTVRFLQTDPNGVVNQLGEDLTWTGVRALPRVGEQVSVGAGVGEVSRVEWWIERSRFWGARALAVIYLQS
jgi:hypothetical protein